MAIIYSYPINSNILGTDIVPGTTTMMVGGKPKNQTKSFSMDGIASFVINLIPKGTLTKVNDSNVTLTIGGDPIDSLFKDVSLTIGWVGKLQDGRIESAEYWNSKQNPIVGVGFVKANGNTISYDNSTYVPTSRTITINGVAQDLSSNRSWDVTSAAEWGGITGDISSQTDLQNALNDKQNKINGTGIVYSSNGIISYLTNNSNNWDTAYNDKINSASVTGTITKTLTLTQQDGNTITANWTDQTGNISLTTYGSSGPATLVDNILNVPNYTGGGDEITLTTNGTSGPATLVDNTLNVPDYTQDGNLVPFLDINADGAIGGPINYIWSWYTSIPAGAIGSVRLGLDPYVNLNVNGSTFPFTATSVEFPTLKLATSVNVLNASSLINIACPLLEVSVGAIAFGSCSNLTTVNFASLKTASQIQFGYTPVLTNVNFSSLENLDSIYITGPNPGVTGFTQTMFPVLKKSGFRWSSAALPVGFEINIPSMTELSYFNSGGGTGLANVNLPGLIKVSSSLTLIQPELTNLILGTVGVTKQISGTTWNFSFCALNQASVDNTLQVLASLDGTNGTTIASNGTLNLSGGTSAAPSQAGLDAKDILLARGWMISTN